MTARAKCSPNGHCFGWVKQQPDARDLKFSVPHAVQAALPQSADLSATVGPVLDQGSEGSCGPNSADTLIMFDQAKQGLRVGSVSRQMVYYATRILMGTVNEDSGVDNRTMLKALAQYGFCEEGLWPYNISQMTTNPPPAVWDAAKQNSITNYAAVAQDLNTMRGCLASGFPFLFGFTVYDSFESALVAQTGTVPMPARSESVLGGHDIVLVGYDDASQRFKFKNSWGTGWGKGGFGTMPYAYATDPNLSGDFWAINTIPGGVNPPTPPIPPGPTPNVPTLAQVLAADDAKFAAMQAEFRLVRGAAPVLARDLADLKAKHASLFAGHGFAEEPLTGDI